MISGSGMADALIATLVAKSASCFDSASGTGNVTKNDFGILDTTTSGSVYIVVPGPGFGRDIIGKGDPGPEEATYTLKVKGCVRDAGNSIETLNRVWQLEKDLAAALAADDELGGAAMLATLARGSPWDEMFYGDPGWAMLDFFVEAFGVD